MSESQNKKQGLLTKHFKSSEQLVLVRTLNLYMHKNIVNKTLRERKKQK